MKKIFYVKSKILKTRDFISTHYSINISLEMHFILLEFEHGGNNRIYWLNGVLGSGISTYLKLLHDLFKEDLPSYYKRKKEGEMKFYL